ncbi:helicase with zinc finger domain 2-like [Asterias rubens]|uniref:helicase with zinc finger domain 2-like n=1 Tax=Asterias rubens TaxID=7604 RepID=UPI0014556862|nr:helicase with zinc finger domain 2-like [Asterias rubens]
MGVDLGLSAGSDLHEGSPGGRINMKLYTLRAKCYNLMNDPQRALKAAVSALGMSPNDIGAQVEQVKAKYNIAKAGGDRELTEFGRFLQDEIPQMVQETVEVADILQIMSEHLGSPIEVASASSTAPDPDWIPKENVQIAKKAKQVQHQGKGKRKQVKAISDNADPVFPIAQSHSQSGSSSKSSCSKLASSLHKEKSPKKGVLNRVGEGNVSVTSARSDTKQKISSQTIIKKPPSQGSSATKLESIPKFRYEMQYACGICFTRHAGARLQSLSDGLLTCADKSVHQCGKTKKVIFVSCEERRKWRKVTPVSKALPPTVTPTMCKFGDRCFNMSCTLPHSNEERELWIFMRRYKLKTLQEVMSAGRAPPETPNTATAYATSSTLAQPPPQEKTHCSYCNETFNEHWQLQRHFLTNQHKSNIKFDKDKVWKHRIPPVKVAGDQYEECQEHKRGTCLFSDSPESCTKAHSKDELEEWMERHRYIVMKIRKAKESKLYAFMDHVLFSYNLGHDVIADELPGMDLTCPDDVKQFLSTEGQEMDSSNKFTWKFTLNTSQNKRLKQVFLLYDEHRTHFKLSQPPDEHDAQLCPGNQIIRDDGNTYDINVIFHSQILGSFNQWILFDVGSAPHLTRKLQVHVSSTEVHGDFDISQRERLCTEVWDSSNMKIVKEYNLSKKHNDLMTKYKVPSPLITDRMEELSRKNYKDYMHKMLYLEEVECNHKISKFATEVSLELRASGGRMYGQVDLKVALMDDSETSQIIERYVQRMMLKFKTSETVYEATIVNNEKPSTSQDTVYLQLSQTCVREQKLRDSTKHQVQIQFQLNRLQFCYMHNTVDILGIMDIVFPAKDNQQRLPPTDVSGEGDQYQNQVIDFICGHEGDGVQSGVGPVLVYGPFGTGKTHTLATAVKKTLQLRPDAKILICTRSNSAADLYITEHLHNETRGSKILRIYAKNRDIKSINLKVKPYVRVDGEGNIRIPKTAEIKTFSVVIMTLASSHILLSGQLKGHFSHILVDEAGQALETETLQPLTLATANTCVVLAGDHIQMSPKIFSKKARHANFDMSLLERLFHLKITRVLLPSNYRTNQAILDFISAAFYKGTSMGRKLKAVANQKAHPQFNYPLVFHTVKGVDQRIGMSFVNYDEVDQVVLSVKNIHDNWPREIFGQLTENSIGIVTPYILQVRQIRKRLQKLELKHVDVQHVQNVQGKQYRVLIVSTVRTRNTLNTSKMQSWSHISPMLRPDETYDHGFLSDIRLLNTAMTRAQSLVLVVGDSVALCSVGKCSTIWQAYLNKCKDHGTLLPTEFTMDMILQGIEAQTQDFTSNLPTLNQSKAHISDTDAILEELFRQMNTDASKATQILRKEGIKFRQLEVKDQIVIKLERRSERDLIKSNDVSYPENDVENDSRNEAASRQDLDQLESNPDKFKVCRFHRNETGELYALPLVEGSKKISVAEGRSGTAMNLDEVMVEVLVNDVESKTIHGKVIRVRKRGPTLFPKMKVVCRLDKYTGNLMLPIDRSLPKFCLRNKKAKTSSQDSTVVTAVHDDGTESQIDVSRVDKPNKLFVVEYSHWFEGSRFPMGRVREELPLCDSKESSLRVLKLCQGVQDNWNSSVLGECESNFPNEWTIPDEEIEARFDARGLNAFTTDPPGSRDIDDALSVEVVDGNYQVGIHIADVSYFVSQDTSLDEDAKNRATSFYSSIDEPTNMLPPRLSNDLCSLLPGRDRLTLSVFVSLAENGSVINDDVVIKRSVIKSRKQLTYEDAEKIIQNNVDLRDVNQDIKEEIQILSKLAQQRRLTRLGEGRFAFSHDPEDNEMWHPVSHSMVEEMMILANQEVARYLTKTYPECAPLRRQLPPSEAATNDWLSKHRKDLRNSVELQSKVKADLQGEDPNDVYMMKDKWEHLRHFVTEEEDTNQMLQITDLICRDENHPRLAVAKANYICIQNKAEFIRSGEHPVDERGHHSLDVASYTQFTSPIRRYFDIMVHRFVISTLNADVCTNDKSQPYDDTKLEMVCLQCNSQTKKAKDFESETRSLRFSLALREAPQTMQVFVKGFSEGSMDLLFPNKQYIRGRSVPLALLKPKAQPQIDEDKTKMELTWRERVYELHGSITIFRKAATTLRLDTKASVVKVSQQSWQQILLGIRQQRPSNISEAVRIAEEENKRGQGQIRKRERSDVVDEITCEKADSSNPAFSVKFMRVYEPGDVIKVVFHSTIERGILTPSIQLIGLTPKLDICIEHRKNAVKCFARFAEKKSGKVTSIEEYIAVWLPIIRMVSAYSAVLDGERSVIHGVNIKWKTGQSQPVTGTFQLPKAFCEERKLKICRGDYVCIRYTDLALDPEIKRRLSLLNKQSAETGRPSMAQQNKTTFVAHAVLSNVLDEDRQVQGKTSTVKVCAVDINQHSASQFPGVLLTGDKLCTIEWIRKSHSERRLEKAVRDLPHAPQIVQQICLQKIPKQGSTEPDIRNVLEAGREIRSFCIPESPLPAPNGPQEDALRHALQEQFTVIHGPPGTGKTVTGAHLTYFFTEVNKKLLDSGKPPQVLYCGPSNKSVDVVAHYLLKLKLPVIRVYNKMVQDKDFPIPGSHIDTSSNEAKMDPGLKIISLHHLIRMKHNSYSERLLGFDKRFQSKSYKSNPTDLSRYRRTIRLAEAEELPRYKVVLCTCNKAGCTKITDLNVIQCIIDEGGMCNEPETLIPLVGAKPRQIVLIGDHKQLRPVIQDNAAIELGMEISLLEKYDNKPVVKMLTFQYRMHKSICDFPSQEFYKGELVPAASMVAPRQTSKVKWPGGADNPIVFCHHIGREEHTSVRGEEGGEQSKANVQEVQHVVRMVSSLVGDLHVKPDNLVVLTQYRHQKFKIEESMKSKGLKINVSTVITSQGNEWDYVILSTVRSLPLVQIDEKPPLAWRKRHLGFITDVNQINVAITRPKLGLIILGNKYLLRKDETWNSLLKHYETKKAVVEANSFPRTIERRKRKSNAK